MLKEAQSTSLNHLSQNVREFQDCMRYVWKIYASSEGFIQLRSPHFTMQRVLRVQFDIAKHTSIRNQNELTST